MKLRSILALAVTIMPSVGAAQNLAGEATLLAAEVDAAGVTFTVRSNGCTHKRDFGVEPISQTPPTIRVVRLRPDYCQAYLPQGTTLRFTYAEIGVHEKSLEKLHDELVILNKVEPL